MYRRLIAVPTCWRYEYFDGGDGEHRSGENLRRRHAVRNTWFNEWRERFAGEIDLKFFYGSGEQNGYFDGENSVVLDAPDDYYNLGFKTRAFVRWALERGYDYVCKIDDDTYVFLDRLLERFEPVDYRGAVREADGFYYASGRVTGCRGGQWK